MLHDRSLVQANQKGRLQSVDFKRLVVYLKVIITFFLFLEYQAERSIWFKKKRFRTKIYHRRVAVSKLIGKVSAFTAIRGGNSPSPQNASSLPLTRAAFQCATSYQARMCAMNEALARMKSACCSKVCVTKQRAPLWRSPLPFIVLLMQKHRLFEILVIWRCVTGEH